MPNYVSQFTAPDGTLLEIKDAYARSAITGGVKYIGKLYVDGATYTHLTDGDTRTSVEIVDATATSGHKTVSPDAGAIVIDAGTSATGNNEFVFDGTTWSMFGQEGELGDFAFVDEGRVTVPNPTYGNPTPNTSSTAATVNIAESNSGNLAITGTFTQPSVTGTASVIGTSTHNTSTTDYPITSTTTIPSGKTKNYTPSGSVSAPTISVSSAGSTTTIKNPTSKNVVTEVTASTPGTTALTGEVVYMEYTANTETLSFKRIAAPTGASITTSNTTVKTGDASYTATAPTFTGTDAYIDVKNVQTIESTGSVTASGDISATASGGAYTPKKYQIDVNYDKTTSVTQGTRTEGSVEKVVTPYTPS